MARIVTFTPAAVEALKDCKPTQANDMLKYLVATHGVGKSVDQADINIDLMKKQFSGVVLSTPSTSSLSKIFDLAKTDWKGKGLMTMTNTVPPKPPKALGKVAQKIRDMGARITELEGALEEAQLALEEARSTRTAA